MTGTGPGGPGVVGGVGNEAGQPIVHGLPPLPETPQVPQRPGGDIHEPRKIRDILPVYPPLAIAARIQGDVVLDCVISAQGKITDVRAISGPPLLVEAARQAAYQWVYTPTLLNGVPIPILLRATVKFHLN
jgi:protein TonB